jgi:hypothetical protein
MEENMATDISSTLFASAMAPQPVFHPAVEPRRIPPTPSQRPLDQDLGQTILDP